MPYNDCELAICKFRNGAKWRGGGAKCLAFYKPYPWFVLHVLAIHVVLPLNVLMLNGPPLWYTCAYFFRHYLHSNPHFECRDTCQGVFSVYVPPSPCVPFFLNEKALLKLMHLMFLKMGVLYFFKGYSVNLTASFYAWWEKVGNWGISFPGNFVIWREILLHGGKFWSMNKRTT